jgi:hypothetical protein
MYIITSYYTKNTPYEKVVDDYLLKSLNKLDLLHHVIGIENLGSHQKNANYKPQFVLDEMNGFPDKDIVFLDADAEVLQNPILFETLNCDIAFHFLDWFSWFGHHKGKKELLPGTLFVKNNDKMKQLVKKWAELAKDSYQWDGYILQQMLEHDKSIEIYNLPIEYCYMKTMPNGNLPSVKIKNPIIVHNQVSRLYRKLK